MIILRQKEWSIQSGHPDKSGSLGRELLFAVKMFAPAAIAVLGINILSYAKDWNFKVSFPFDALLIAVGLKALLANKRKEWVKDSTIEKLSGGFWNKVLGFSKKMVRDEEPKDHVISVGYSDGSMVILLNKPSTNLLDHLNNELENMVEADRKSNYLSKPTKSGYIVFVEVPNNTVAETLVRSLVSLSDTSNDKLNIITKIPEKYKNLD